MSTPTATGMLKDIFSETMQQLLNNIRYTNNPPGSTMLPELDKQILENLPGTTSKRTALNRGDVIEIQGPAASGKTHFLYHLAACCILPTEVLIVSLDTHAECTVLVEGWNKSVVVFDCDGRWDIRRLYQILTTRLKEAFSKSHLPPLPHKPGTTFHAIARESLSRLHVFRPTSSFQLAATLLHLPKYHGEQMPKEEIRLLFVDSISSFYWMDRWQAESSASSKSHRFNPLIHVLRTLQVFRISHGPVIILTNWGINPSTIDGTAAGAPRSPFFKQHLPAPYPAALDDLSRQDSSELPNVLSLTFHITLPFPFASQLQLDLGHSDNSVGQVLDQALHSHQRTEEVNRGEILGYVRIPRTDNAEALPSRSTIGRFTFRILEQDVSDRTKSHVQAVTLEL